MKLKNAYKQITGCSESSTNIILINCSDSNDLLLISEVFYDITIRLQTISGEYKKTDPIFRS